jgi:hypothetical protein
MSNTAHTQSKVAVSVGPSLQRRSCPATVGFQPASFVANLRISKRAELMNEGGPFMKLLFLHRSTEEAARPQEIHSPN